VEASDVTTKVSELFHLFRLFRREQADPEGFYSRLAELAVPTIHGQLDGARVLDLGCGPGYYSRELARAGAHVVSLDSEAASLGEGLRRAVVGDARVLPLADASIDGVFSSNVLEHVADPDAFFSEIERVLRPGGWAWVSWTTWYSPWGGHEMSPFHYLGPRLGAAVHRRVRSYPLKNIPGTSLFPRHITATIRLLAKHPDLRCVDAVPRYYPGQRWILHLPGLREMLAWNCLLYIERR
jgi:SAM-dependent methyltransferase